MKWLILLLLTCINIKNQICLELISSTRTSYLQNYGGYMDVVPIHLEIPKEIKFASFKFVADEEQVSIFGCTPRSVSLYVKPKALPVLNLDDSAWPKSFKDITRTKPDFVEIISDKKQSFYYNLTSPEPGCYYLAATLPYTDPKHAAIKPPGLTAECYPFIIVSVYVEKEKKIEQILEGQSKEVKLNKKSRYYKFYVPELVSHAIIIINKVNGIKDSEKVTLRVQSNSLPQANNTLKSLVIDLTSGNSGLSFNTKGGSWHYAQFETVSKNADNKSSLEFSLKFFFEEFNQENETNTNNTEFKRIYKSELIENVMPYQQFDLVRESNTDSFTFAFELPNKRSNLAINLTNNDFAIIRFRIREHTDIGGALQFSASFKPRVNREKRLVENEPENNKIVACLRPEIPEVPSWPNLCKTDNEENTSPIILNKTTTNSSMVVPFPESGIWYATFKLFCGECSACNCSKNCRKQFEECVNSCERTCSDAEKCYNCSIDCKREIIKKNGCSGCNCDGACLRKEASDCRTSVIFDLSSVPCVNNCGKNGRCLFMVSDGVVYTACVCTNNYRGWDCSDGSQANPFGMVLLELLLLVFSNLMFLPTVFVAYKRRYYVEAICYFSIFFFSTFYHACDAGENIYSFCITRMGALQFADFYCALLSIWVTIIAIADLTSFWPVICQMLGAIILAFITTINKTAAWVFIVPAVAGVIIIAISWFLKWKKVRQMFLERRYLRIYIPLGLVVGTTGILIYTLLETTNNYKYLHSLWHMFMAITVILLLPRKDTFQPQTIL